MNEKIIKCFTPLRFVTIYFVIWAIIEFIDTERMIKKGYEPGLGGLGYIALTIAAILTIGLDILFFFLVKPKTNWLLQFCLVLIVFIWSLSL